MGIGKLENVLPHYSHHSEQPSLQELGRQSPATFCPVKAVDTQFWEEGNNVLGKGAKKREKKLTSVSFLYVCVAGIGEMLVFFSPFFPQH